MTRFLFLTVVLGLTIFSFTPPDNLVGKYKVLCHTDAYYEIDLHPDSTFKQRNFVVWDKCITEGKWKVNADTLFLDIKTVYEVTGKRKQTQVTDTSSHIYKIAMKHSSYKIKQEKLLMLYKMSDTTIIPTCWLTKIKN